MIGIKYARSRVFLVRIRQTIACSKEEKILHKRSRVFLKNKSFKEDTERQNSRTYVKTGKIGHF